MTVRHRDLARYGLFGETEIGAHTFDTILGVPIPDGRQALRVVHRTYSCGNRLKNWSPERPGDQRCILLNGDRRIEVGSGQTLGRALARHESATAVVEVTIVHGKVVSDGRVIFQEGKEGYHEFVGSVTVHELTRRARRSDRRPDTGKHRQVDYR